MAQSWSAVAYEKCGSFVPQLAGEVFSWLDPRPGERILDLGCGPGVLTGQIRQAGADVVGVDSSPEMVEAARTRGLTVHLGKGEKLFFSNEFDAVFSNAALHWMTDQRAVLAGVHRALRSGGRFVAELGGHANIAAIRTALRAIVEPLGVDAEGAGANTFFTVDEYRALLQDAGFEVERIELVPRPTFLPTGMRGWLTTFRRWLLEQLTMEQQERVLSGVEEMLRPILCDREGNWYGDYVRLRFRAHAQAQAKALP